MTIRDPAIANGVKGPAGAQGPQGPQGPQGIAPTVSTSLPTGGVDGNVWMVYS